MKGGTEGTDLEREERKGKKTKVEKKVAKTRREELNEKRGRE